MFASISFVMLAMLASCNGFSAYQTEIVRKQMKDHEAPQWAAITDSILAQNYAFADQAKSLVYIDAARFECCPNSFANVMAHEVSHLNMRDHNDPANFVKDDPMSYALSIMSDGTVVNDKFLLPPRSASQPWIMAMSKQSEHALPIPASVVNKTKLHFLPVKVVGISPPKSGSMGIPIGPPVRMGRVPGLV